MNTRVCWVSGTGRILKTTEFLFSCLQQKSAEVERERSQEELIVRKKDFAANLPIAERKKITHCAKRHRKGHWARECPMQERREAAMFTEGVIIPTDNDEEEVILCTAAFLKGFKNSWVADSGATSHMANSRDWFRNLTLYK